MITGEVVAAPVATLVHRKESDEMQCNAIARTEDEESVHFNAPDYSCVVGAPLPLIAKGGHLVPFATLAHIS